MAENMGDWKARLILDVSEAIQGYTKARQEHLSTVSALGQGAGTLTTIGTTLAAAGVGLAAGLAVAVNAAAEFERKLDYFSAVSAATQDEYEAIRQKALQLGADTIYSADQIADSFVELAKSGVSTKELLDGIGEAVANLGAATDMPLEAAATSLTSVLNTFGLAATDAVGVVDQLAGAANASSIDVQDLILTLSYAGASAKTAGISFEDINAAIALLGERGIRGSKAGTGLRQVMDKLIAPTNKGAEALRELGIQAEDGSSKLRTAEGTLKPLPAVLDELNGALDGMTQAQKMDVLGQIFPITSLPTVLNLLDGGSAALARMNEEINKTTAMDIAGERLDNLSGDVEYLRGELDTLIITIGTTQQSFVRQLVQSIESVVAWLNQLDPAILDLIVRLTAFAASGLIMVGALGMLSGSILNTMELGYALIPVLGLVARAFGITATRATVLAFVLRALPFAALVGLLSMVAGALTFFFTQTEQGQAVWSQFMGVLSSAMATVMPIISQLVTLLGGWFTEALSAIGPLLTQIAGIFTGIFSSGVSGGASLLQTIGGFLNTVGSTLSGIFSSGLQIAVGLLQIVGNILSAVIAPLLPIINQLLEGTAAAFAGVGQSATGLNTIGGLFGSILAGLINMIPVILTAVVQLITLILQAVVAALPMMITGFLQLFTGIIQALTTILPLVIQGVMTLITGIITALVAAIPLLITGALQLFTGLVNALVLVLPLVIQGLLQLLLGIVTALTTMLPILIQGAVTLFTGIITALTTLLPTILTVLVEVVMQLVFALIGMIPQLLDAGIQLFMGIVMALPQIIPPLIEAIVGLLPTLITTVLSLLPMLLDAALQLFMAIVMAIPQIIGPLISAIIGLLPTIVSTVIGLLPQLLSAAVQLFMAIVTAIPRVVPQVVSALSELGPQLVGAVMKMVPQMVQAGSDLIRGLGNGIKKMGQWVLDQIGSVINGAIGWAKDLLGIKSPSRVFRDIGNNTIAGMIVGMKAMGPALNRQMGMVSDSIDSFYDQVYAAREMDVMLNLASQMSTLVYSNSLESQLATLNEELATIADKDTIYIDKYETNNPAPEPASDSLPKNIRKAAFVLNG